MQSSLAYSLTGFKQEVPFILNNIVFLTIIFRQLKKKPNPETELGFSLLLGSLTFTSLSRGRLYAIITCLLFDRV
jgi:hypothetical protein